MFATLVCVKCDCVVNMDGCDGGVSTVAAWCVVQLVATAMALVRLV